MDGIIIINKEKDYTSRDIVNIACKSLGTKKIGHTGTLDPMATGVLILTVGKATKLTNFLTSSEKEYEAEIKFGDLTDTLDITGNLIKEDNTNITNFELDNVLSDLTGKYIQEVPIYSAVKVNGKKLYEYARGGEEVELPKREVEIKKLIRTSDIKMNNDKQYCSIKTVVSKGTYIRSLIYDIALSLNTVAVMSALIRTKQGKYNIKQANSLDDLKSGKCTIIPIKEILSDIPIKDMNEFRNKIINGNKLEANYREDKVMFIEDDKVIAIYERVTDKLFKPSIMF